MNDADFGIMAYRIGPAKLIRDRILESTIRQECTGWAHIALIRTMRSNPSKTESAWLKKYDAARAKNGGAA